MRVGDLIRYQEVVHHATPVSYTDFKLGVLIGRRHNLCDILTLEGEKIILWASLVQKAGKKDEEK